MSKHYECVHCWIEVVPITREDAVKIWGTGELPKWKHTAARDADGHPSCGRKLKDEDVATVTSKEA